MNREFVILVDRDVVTQNQRAQDVLGNDAPLDPPISVNWQANNGEWQRVDGYNIEVQDTVHFVYRPAPDRWRNIADVTARCITLPEYIKVDTERLASHMCMVCGKTRHVCEKEEQG